MHTLPTYLNKTLHRAALAQTMRTWGWPFGGPFGCASPVPALAWTVCFDFLCFPVNLHICQNNCLNIRMHLVQCKLPLRTCKKTPNAAATLWPPLRYSYASAALGSGQHKAVQAPERRRWGLAGLESSTKMPPSKCEHGGTHESCARSREAGTTWTSAGADHIDCSISFSSARFLFLLVYFIKKICSLQRICFTKCNTVITQPWDFVFSRVCELDEIRWQMLCLVHAWQHARVGQQW